MKKYLGILGRMVLAGMVMAGLLFSPQYSVLAAPVLTVTPVTWNVIGLDSNNVNVGPANYPVGARICNTGDQPSTNVVADFVWDDGAGDYYPSNAYINLRSGSYSILTFASLAATTCVDAYFEVTISRDANA